MSRKASLVMVAAMTVGLVSSAYCSVASAQTYNADPLAPSKGRAFMFYQRALQLHQAGDVTGAIGLYKQALSHNPRDKHAHHYLGLALSQTGADGQAISEFKNALNIDYNFVECRNNYAMVLKKRGDRDAAQKQFVECIKINPRYPFAYHHLGEILQEKGDLQHAIEAYETATRLKPDHYEAQRDLGLAIFERAEAGDVSQALEKLQIAAKLVPNNPMIRFHLASIYCADGRLDEAEAEFRRTLMLDPQHAAGHWELARLRYLRGDLDRPIYEIKEAEKINPNYTASKKYPKVDPIALKFLSALCKERKGQKIEAVEAWKEMASMVPNNAIALKHINDLETELRRAAKKKKTKPLPYDPEEIEALVIKGIGQYDDGDLDGSKASFTRALELNPQSFEAMQNLGACLEAAGDLNGAMAKYQAAMAVKPDFDGAYYNLAFMLEKLNLPADAGLMYQRFHEIAGRYPYDPKHIVALQQEDARQRAKQELLKRRGY